MSLRSLKADLERFAPVVYEGIINRIDQHGLDPEAPEVQEIIVSVFGDQVCNDFGDWYDE